jgi:hypothetical protein
LPKWDWKLRWCNAEHTAKFSTGFCELSRILLGNCTDIMLPGALQSAVISIWNVVPALFIF